MEGLQSAPRRAKSSPCFSSGGCDLCCRGSGPGKHSLLIPGVIRGRARQPVCGISAERFKKPIKPLRADTQTAFKKYDDIRITAGHQPVEASRWPEGFG